MFSSSPGSILVCSLIPPHLLPGSRFVTFCWKEVGGREQSSAALLRVPYGLTVPRPFPKNNHGDDNNGGEDGSLPPP